MVIAAHPAMVDRAGDLRGNNKFINRNSVMKRGNRFLIGLAAAVITFGSLYAFAPAKMGAGNRHCFGHNRHAFNREDNDHHLQSQAKPESPAKPVQSK